MMESDLMAIFFVSCCITAGILIANLSAYGDQHNSLNTNEIHQDDPASGHDKSSDGMGNTGNQVDEPMGRD